MPIHEQIGNIRTCIPRHMHFASEEGERQYLARVERARAAQQVPYAVAPDQQLKTKLGKFLQAGEEVTADDVGDALDAHGRVLVASTVRLKGLVREGIVLEKY